MEMRKLLETMTKFAGRPEGEPAGASESVLKDLSKGPTPKTKEEELAEMWAKFNEADIGVEPKRPHRKGTRADKLGRRGHKEQPRYTTVKEVETITPIAAIKPGNAPTNPAADPNAIKQAIAATSAMKAATGSSAPAPNLAKALDAASQGKPISSTDAKVMEPIMDIVSKAAQDPKLANQFKTLAQQAKNTP